MNTQESSRHARVCTNRREGPECFDCVIARRSPANDNSRRRGGISLPRFADCFDTLARRWTFSATAIATLHPMQNVSSDLDFNIDLIGLLVTSR